MDAKISINIDPQQRVTNTLLLNASFIGNLGVMHGKIGISIFFFHLARQTKNKIYEDYAGELIDEIYEEITANTPVDFENGLAGIGWGIEYLVQNKFIEADTDEVLEEFDNRIFKELIYNTPKDIGLLNGIIGIGAYFLKRVQSASRQGRDPDTNDEKISALTNKQTIIHLIDELERKTQNIAKIISEPLSERSPSDNPSTTVTIETKGTKETTPSFDLTWNYPVLLWFLAELHQQNIFNFKVEKVIQRLVEPLSDNTNFPKLQSNRLLLALALTKLSQTIETKKTIETSKISLLTNINRETIKSELPTNNPTIRYGTSGIARVYRQLHRLTGDNHFKKEMEYWASQNLLIAGEEKGFGGLDIENASAFGILEGLAGTLPATEALKQLEPNQQKKP